MTTVEVQVGDWDHECCGDAVERGGVVEGECVVPPHGMLCQVNHGVEDGLVSATVTGRVVEVAVLHTDGRRVPVERIPSGRELRLELTGPTPLVHALTGAGVALGETEDFVVTLQV